MWHSHSWLCAFAFALVFDICGGAGFDLAFGLDLNMQLQIKFFAIASLLIAMSLAAETPIHRRPLTRAEIAAAIQKSFATNGFSTESPLSPADITIISPIAVTEAHPNLDVTQIESRPGSNTTHVALWTASEPRIPPFWVTVDRRLEPIAAEKSLELAIPDHAQPTQAHYISRTRIGRRPLTPAAAAAQAPLVHAGNPIQLIVQGAGMRIMTKGKALETGRAGQQIRVQTEPAGKVLAARIVTSQTAEIDY